MTQLPATYVDARALEFARDWIAWHRESPNGMFHPNAAAVYGTSLMKQFAQSHPFGADDVAYFAEHGSKALQNWIRKRGFPRGQLTGPNTRTWGENEVQRWLDSRPTAIKPSLPKASGRRGRRRKADHAGGIEITNST